MADDDQPRRVYEPEVLPPERDGRRQRSRSTVAVVRWRRLLQAALSGLVLDAADLLTRTPLIPHGAILGLLVGGYVVRTQDVPRAQRIWWVAASALYCAMPLTEFYPLATLFLVYRACTRKPVVD